MKGNSPMVKFMSKVNREPMELQQTYQWRQNICQKLYLLHCKQNIFDNLEKSWYFCRSAAHVKLKQYDKAVQDARTAKQLKPDWPKVCNAFTHKYHHCF